ncbi:hypothetical protein M3P21_19195 [Ruegeria sp. 2012CJ41-6]|uniref:Uncharacterized protein n=1 Tax=Ruegeria spongiae TaxID=2942209 RepID=A0ABT0Q700_9RHOB|nr:hypothetical protein [Ruegeria spongiae]MCL6285659.1 hypothetical protein [Ruegeria spongiae]
MIGTAFSTSVGVIAAATAARLGDKPARDGILSAFAALFGTFLSLLKTSAGERHYPDLELIAQPLFFYFAAVLIFVLPLATPSKEWSKTVRAIDLISRAATALFLGLIVGLLAQGIAELFWSGTTDRFSARKFVVAPSMIVAGCATLNSVMMRNQLSSLAPNQTLVTVLFALGVAAIVGFASLSYFPRHSGPSGWLTQAGATVTGVVIVFLGMLGAPILAGALAAVLRVRCTPNTLFVALSFLFSAFAGAAAWKAGKWRLASGNMIEADMPVLIGTQAISVVLSSLVVILANAWHSRLVVWFRKPPKE